MVDGFAQKVFYAGRFLTPRRKDAKRLIQDGRYTVEAMVSHAKAQRRKALPRF
jgi:hypothetical protein